MIKLLLGALLGAVFIYSAQAGQEFRQRVEPRPVFVPRQMPVQPRMVPVPRFNNFNRGLPEMRPQFARPGVPVVHGRFGDHFARNRTMFVRLPRFGAVLSPDGQGDADVEDIIDSTDASSPIEPTAGCDPCTTFGAISISLDGTSGWASGYPDAASAQEAAQERCVGAATEQCTTMSVAGTGWVAAVHCQNDSMHGTSLMIGNDPAAAIRNVYRSRIQAGIFSVDDCTLVALIAANGAQNAMQEDQGGE